RFSRDWSSDVCSSDLPCEAEHILSCCIIRLIEIPIRVLVVLVITVPTCVSAVCILVVLKPFLIVGARQGHKIFTDIALGVAKGGTVLYILTSIVCREVEINRSRRSIYPEVEVVTTHVGVGKNVLVTHIGERETGTCLTGVYTQNSGILSRQACTEK